MAWVEENVIARYLSHHTTIYNLLGNLPWLSNAAVSRPQQTRASAPLCSLSVLPLPVTFVFWIGCTLPAGGNEQGQQPVHCPGWSEDSPQGLWHSSGSSQRLQKVTLRAANKLLKGFWHLHRLWWRTFVCIVSSYPLGENNEWTRKQGNIPHITILTYCAHCLTSVQSLE